MPDYDTLRLPRAFFKQPTLHVAQELIGCRVAHVSPDDGVVRTARIVETEAYVGVNDLACHASKGRTPRTEVMFGAPGHAYLYLIYGLHWCFNVVTEPTGSACAVLIRAAEGLEHCEGSLSGPGRFSRAMHLDGRRNGHDWTGSALWLEPREGARPTIVTGARVNVAYAGAWADRPWRFAEDQQPAVSVPRPFRLDRRKR